MSPINGDKWVFRLFISGKSPKADKSVLVLEQICEKYLEGNCDIEVVDVKKDPASAINEDILATPTLLKKLPEPARRIIGDLSDREKIRLALEIVT